MFDFIFDRPHAALEHRRFRLHLRFLPIERAKNAREKESDDKQKYDRRRSDPQEQIR
jgi:hypothetical protein